MYLVRSLRTFIGTNAERTAAGLESFLPGDEYIETDTSLVYIHNGMAWLLNSSAGSPGGSDTQIQFNDDGVFGGASGLVWNDSINTLTHTKNTSTTLEYFLVLDQDGSGGAYINMIAGAASGRIGMRSTSFDISSSSPVNITGSTVGLSSSGTITMDAGGYAATIFEGSGSDPAAIFNNPNWGNYHFQIKTENNDYMVWVDSGDDSFNVGTSSVGTLLQVSAAGIVFNNGENDINFRISGNGVTNAYFYDAGLNRHGFGTGTPGAFVYIDNTETSGTPETGLTVDNTYSPSSDPGSVFPTSLSLLADYDSSTTPSGGFVLAQFLRARNVSNGVMSARCLDIQFQNLGTGTTPFFTGVNVRTPTNSGGGAITTAYGLKVESQNIAGTNYAIYTDAGRVRFGDGVTIDTTTAALTVPRMTTTQQNALTGVNGMLIFNSTTGKFTGYAGGAWVALH